MPTDAPTPSSREERPSREQIGTNAPREVGGLKTPLDILLGVQFVSNGPNTNILGRLSPKDREKVFANGLRYHFEAGEHLFRQSERHNGIFFIESGLVKVYYTSPSGKQATLAFWDARNFVGGPDIFGDCNHIWSGVAFQKTACLFLAGNTLRKLAYEMPDLAVGLVEGLSYKGRCYSIFGQLLATHTATERLAILFYYLSKNHGSKAPGRGTILPPFTHEELSCLIGATRQWVTATLRRFEQNGFVSSRRGRIVVYDSIKSVVGTEIHD